MPATQIRFEPNVESVVTMIKKNALIEQKFGDRDFDSLTERNLRQMYRELPFDMFLVASNDEKIPVHYFAMILFSTYLRNKFKGELIFKPNIDVPLKRFSHEILKEIVQFIYFGEAWINSNKTMEFIEVVRYLELLCTCSGSLVARIRCEKETDDGLKGYVDFSRDAASIAIHEDGKMFWDCEFPGCSSKTITKVVDGVVIIKSIQPLHSTECLKAQAEHKSSESENKDAGKILTPKNGLAKEDGLSDWSSDISDNISSEDYDDPELDSHSSENWSTDDSTDSENDGEKFDGIKTYEFSVWSEDNSDSSSLEVVLPK